MGNIPTRSYAPNATSVSDVALTAMPVVTATVMVVAAIAAHRSYGAGSFGRPALSDRCCRSRVATMPVSKAAQTTRCLT